VGDLATGWPQPRTLAILDNVSDGQ
jgi:hypothetical protein